MADRVIRGGGISGCRCRSTRVGRHHDAVDRNVAPGHPGRPFVLVVEDEENVAFVIAAVLRLSGLEVAQAKTGREALNLLGGGLCPDLVVLDVMLPDLDGFEVCRRVRADFGDVPIAFLTARDAIDDRVRGLTLGTTVARDAVVETSASYSSRPITLQSDGPVVVTGDADALRQLVDNLVGNALSHTRGPVTVSVARSHGVAELVVSDTGPGMSAAAAAHALDRFWQADPSRAGSGSGLGLSIVAAIVAAHQGSVAIDSQPGAGTKVLVTLPLRLSSAGAVAPAT
jgi:CheY-like chemotaxis protein